MEFVKIYDHLEKQDSNSEISIALIFEEKSAETKRNSYIPANLDKPEEKYRIATYISWYNEAGYLFFEERAMNIDSLIELLQTLKNSGINPKGFEEISYREPEQMEIVELKNGFKVLDKQDKKYYTTEGENSIGIMD